MLSTKGGVKPTFPVTDAIRLDRLLQTETGQKLFPMRRNSSYQVKSAKSVEKSLSNIRPSGSFVSNTRDSSVPYMLTPNVNKTFKIQCKDIENAHQQIVNVNEKMKNLEIKYHSELGKLEQRLTPQRRRQITDGIKGVSTEYKELKANRLKFIKQSRVMKNEYPEGLKGFEIFYWKEEKAAGIINHNQSCKNQARSHSK